MAAFHYIGMNSKGEKQKGIIEAESEKHARQLIRDKHLIPFEVKPTHLTQRPAACPRDPVATSGSRGQAAGRWALRVERWTRKPNISTKELALLTRQLATLISAGLPIEEVLNTVAEQTEKPRTKGLILSVRSKVVEGHALASALREYPDAFSALYCSTVAAGEKSGHLEVVLQRLADYTEQQFSMRRKIQNALIYPAIMVFISFGIVGFLLEYVVPRMVSVYSNIGQTLPMMTQVLIGFSSDVKSYGIYLLIALCIGVFFLRRQIKNSLPFKEKVHTNLLRIPVIGNANKVINTARFSRTFAILSSAGVSVLEAMSIASQLITNLPIRKAVEEAAKRVREGASIHLALKQTGYFPPMSIHLIASGETSGQLENMLERAANNQDEEITGLIETALTLFEPMIILIMGGIVLFIVLAVLLPIFQLDQFAG